MTDCGVHAEHRGGGHVRAGGLSSEPLIRYFGGRPTVTISRPTTRSTALVAIDIAKRRNEVLIAVPGRRAPPRPRHRLRQPILRSNPTTLPKSRTTAPRPIPTQRRTARTLRTSQLAVLNRLPHPPDHRHQRNVGACAPRNPRCPCSPTKPEQCDKSSLARLEIIRKIPHGFT